MVVATEEKTMAETMLNKEDLEYKIEIATQTLDPVFAGVQLNGTLQAGTDRIFGLLQQPQNQGKA